MSPVGGTQPGGNAAPATSQPQPQASKEMFLQLLVAQIKNQNPLNPADGVQFLSQLAQFSELEQLVGMRQDLAGLREDLKPNDPSSGKEA